MPTTPPGPPMPPNPSTPSAQAAPCRAAPAPAWWTPDGGFDGAPEPVSLPSPANSNAATRVCLVGLRNQTDRSAARLGIRRAVCAALARLTGADPAAIALPAAPGEAPYALVGGPAAGGAAAGSGGRRRIALAISHDEALSVAAIGLDGPVGVDVMRVADVPDWEALARDYLGPDTARALAALAPAQRPHALAKAWSEREARLKCLGRALAEWQPDEPAALAQCACLALALPEGYVGWLALAEPLQP